MRLRTQKRSVFCNPPAIRRVCPFLILLFCIWAMPVSAQDSGSIVYEELPVQGAVDSDQGASAPGEEAGEEIEDEIEEEPPMVSLPVVKLRSLDKITARTSTFQAAVGNTVKFGSLYVKARTCRKATPLENPESAAFLQIWEITPEGEAEWVFSGWMFASSPGLSSMDHPIYDVWVLDCMEEKGAEDAAEKKEQAERGEGELSEDEVPDKPSDMEEGARLPAGVLDGAGAANVSE